MERLLGRAVWLGGIIALLALVIVSRHDIARYIKMARMQRVHEFGPCTGIVEAARSRAGGRPVRRVRVRVGARHRFDPEVMRHTFALVAEGTELADAQLDIVVVEAEQACGACGDTRTVADPVPVCPACGAVAVTARGGDELLLESLEYAG